MLPLSLFYATPQLQLQFFQSGKTTTDHHFTATLQLCAQLDALLRDG